MLGDFGEVVVLDWGLAKFVDRVQKEPDDPSPVVDSGSSSEIGLTVKGKRLVRPRTCRPNKRQDA